MTPQKGAPRAVRGAPLPKDMFCRNGAGTAAAAGGVKLLSCGIDNKDYAVLQAVDGQI